MQIAFFIASSLLSGGGSHKWVFDAAMMLSKKHRVSVFALKYFYKRRWASGSLLPLKNIARYYEFPYAKLSRGSAFPCPFHLVALSKLLNTHDVVYVVIPAIPNELLFHFLKSSHILTTSVIGGLHGSINLDTTLHRAMWFLLKRSMKSFTCLHVLNRPLHSRLVKEGYSHVFNIPNGVNTKLFRLCHNPADYKRFNVLYVGRLERDKGIDILASIISHINRKSNTGKIDFTICGSGSLEHIIKKLAKQYNNTHYLGFVQPAALPDLYRSAQLLLLPSRIEGLPLSLLEGQSCGLPAVCSRIPGVSDMIVNGKNGHLVQIGDITGFAKTIRGYYNMWRKSPEEYYRLKRTIRDYIVANYDWSIVIDKLEEMFRAHARYPKRK